MKNIIVLFLLLLNSTTSLLSQTSKSDLDKIPVELVHINVNTKLAFAGEYLYYKFYCTLADSKMLSSLSKVGYVDFINEDKKVVFQHKLILEKGTAYSEFFIPADLPSGNYKLIGYTNWMRNFGANTFFNKDITILNPYLGNQTVFLEEDFKENLSRPISLVKISNGPGDETISLGTDKAAYSKREKVNLNIESKLGKKIKGTYSLSVRKKTALDGSLENRETLSKSNSAANIKPISYRFLPESRGAFLSGSIRQQKGTIQKLMISLPGKNNLFHVATTDNEGNFDIPLSAPYNNENIYIIPFSDSNTAGEISLKTMQNIEYGNLDFETFILNESMKKLILERSIHNQIENAFFDSKPDSLAQPKPFTPFYDGETTQYALDDYTRFSTLKETFVEILKYVSIHKNSKGSTFFKVIPMLPLIDSGETSLVLLDGAYIHNHERLLEIPAKSIEKITIARDQYLYGSYSFQGIMDIRTFEGDAFKTYLDPQGQSFPQKQFRIKKNYYSEDYSGSKLELKRHIPDFRNQLAWIPEIKETKSTFNTSFYTSDVTGKFEITLEGISSEGIPIRIKESFTVK
ncbi:MAG: hypothetical protein AB8B59_10715 [Maribacter sp.]